MPALRLKLFPKYAVLIIAMVGVLLAASGALSLYVSYLEILSHATALQVEKAQAAATRIEQYVQDIEQQVSWTALPGLDTGDDVLGQRRIDYLKLLRQVPAITEATWIDAQGKEQMRISRLAMDSSGKDIDRSAEPLFKEAIAGRVYRSPVSFRKETEPYMTISRRAGGHGGGVTAVDVNLKFVWDVVSRIQIGQRGLAYVVDNHGVLIAHPDISLVLKKTDLSALPQVADVMAKRSSDGTHAVARDLGGEPMLAANARIPLLDWTVFVESPRVEALQPLWKSLRLMGQLLALGLVVSVIASFLLARALVRPIQALQEGVARVGAGDWSHRITVKTGDELEALAGEFNRMSDELAASYAGLERKVDERTTELSEALERQTATAEILQVISRSVADTQPVFERILASCRRLFASSEQGIMLVDEAGRVRVVAHDGQAREGLQQIFSGPQPPIGREALIEQMRRRIVLNIRDVLADEGVPGGVRRVAEQLGIGSYSQIIAAMAWEDQPVGFLYVIRQPSSGFTDKEVTLLTTFADQAVIAIQNARLFRELQEKTAQLEAANRHKSEFLANMSHELRTPLNAIIGFSEALIEQMFGEVNEKQMEYLQDIHGSGQHLLSLINDVLDLSKIEAGRMELELSCFDLGLLLEHSSTLVRERAQRHGLTLTLDIGDGLHEWVADARKIKQAVVNLLSNAVKFTPNGGAVTVRARRQDPAGGGGVEVQVIDTGIGIAAHDQQLVFEEFRQASGDVMRKSEGTGLGLALVKRFVELHGGTVSLQSAPGAGSTFAFTLPPIELEAVQ